MRQLSGNLPVRDTHICAELVSAEEAANVDKVAVQVEGSVVNS